MDSTSTFALGAANPDTCAASGADGFLVACNNLMRLEASRYESFKPNGDYQTDGWPAISDRQKPQLDLICEPVQGERLATYQAARVRCFDSVQEFVEDDQMSGDGLRLVRAIFRDMLAA